MTPTKTCPLVFRTRGAARDILAFEHPHAGCQLVKGTIEPGESAEAAALRELAEESGIRSATIVRHVGLWPAGPDAGVWAFVECRPPTTLPDAWTHEAPDDGGHTFRFFWHPLADPPDPARWHPVFQRALAFIQAAEG